LSESNEKKTFFGDEVTYIRKASEDDYSFIYHLVEEFLKTDLSVTVLEMPTFQEFFKSDTKRYIITNGNDNMGFVQILKNNEVGYFVDPKFQGKGIGTEAVKILMELNPRNRYFATINNRNDVSIKLIKKLGFRPKATIFEKINE